MVMKNLGTRMKVSVALLIMLGLGLPLIAQRAPALDQEFRLSNGRSSRVTGTDLSIRFDRVTEDSRCPTDVQCITAGDATVAITITSGRTAAQAHTLHTHADAREVLHGAYRVALVSLEPLPVSTRPTRQRDYVITLRVDRPASR